MKIIIARTYNADNAYRDHSEMGRAYELVLNAMIAKREDLESLFSEITDKTERYKLHLQYERMLTAYDELYDAYAADRDAWIDEQDIEYDWNY